MSKENFKRERTRGLIICERETERQRAGSCLPAESSAATDRAESPAAVFTQECDHHPCNHPTIQPVNLRAAGYLVTISNDIIQCRGIHCQIYYIEPLHCKEDSNDVFLEIKLRGLVPNFHIHTSVSDLYIPRIGPPNLLQPNRQTDCGNI